MEKENVLEIEITALNDEYSLVKVTKINDEVIKEGGKYSFGYADSSTLLMNSALRTAPSFSTYFSDAIECFDLYLHGKNDCFTVKNILTKSLKTFIKEFNKKYGVPKRWRAEEGEAYFYIDVYNNIEETVDNHLTSDKLHYDMGNYFKTEEETKRISTELCNFWEKVRNGRIEEEGTQKE